MNAKRIGILVLLAGMLGAATGYAQEPPKQKPPAAQSELKGRVFQLNHRSPRALLQVLQPLTSGTAGSVITASDEMQAISVRDFAENLQAIEAAIRLLDRPEAGSRRVGLEIQISLIGAYQDGAEGDGKLPPFLAPVVAQLQRTLSFKTYRYITTLNQRTLDQGRVGASGVITNFFPGKDQAAAPAGYEYNFQDLRLIPGTGERATIQVGDFFFVAMVPVVVNPKQVAVGVQPPQFQQQKFSFSTGLSLQEGEQVVVGTSSAGGEDKAIIVVVSIRRASA